VRELIAKADVVVENFSTGVMAAAGSRLRECRKIKPEIIYCSVSAYGRDGAFADRLGFDPIAQVESGFVSMNGYADREGVRALSPVMDISTAMMACNAILGALVARERSGQGPGHRGVAVRQRGADDRLRPLQHLFQRRGSSAHGNTSP
jgi:crotonobetainyl-CoA:carnitine CoA-transferase CaiB-like acyl-CoA transferase